MSYSRDAEQAASIAAKWAEAFEPVEPEPEPEPEPPGKGNVIPSAGQSPEFTEDQRKALLKSGKTNNELLAELLAEQNAAYRWYGPQK